MVAHSLFPIGSGVNLLLRGNCHPQPFFRKDDLEIGVEVLDHLYRASAGDTHQVAGCRLKGGQQIGLAGRQNFCRRGSASPG